MIEKVVLDASALIALIYQEKGQDTVEQHIAHAEISAVNLSEVAAYMIKNGNASTEITELLKDLSLDVIDFDQSQSLLAAQLITKTAAKGLSLGDRACLALAISRKRTAITADKIWGSLQLDAKVQVIR